MPLAFPLSTHYAAQRQYYQEAMARRYSCRAYSRPLSDKQASNLSALAARVCLPGVRIAIAPCPENLFFGLPIVGKIHGMSHYACIFVQQDADHAAIRAGISGEAFVLEATAVGIGTCWVSGSYRRSAVSAACQTGEKLLAVTPLGIPDEGHSKALGRHKPPEKLCTTDFSAWPCQAQQAVQNVCCAPSAVNLQPWKLSYAGHTLTLTAGGKTDTLDMGIAMLHMECAMDGAHRWTWGEGKNVAHLSIEENQ